MIKLLCLTDPTPGGADSVVYFLLLRVPTKPSEKYWVHVEIITVYYQLMFCNQWKFAGRKMKFNINKIPNSKFLRCGVGVAILEIVPK